MRVRLHFFVSQELHYGKDKFIFLYFENTALAQTSGKLLWSVPVIQTSNSVPATILGSGFIFFV
jgi:hypothetical protein